MKKILKITFAVIILLLIYAKYLMPNTKYSYALNMYSPRYQILYGNVNMGAQNDMRDADRSKYRLWSTMGQSASGQYDSFGAVGYTIKAGFQYFHAIVPFTFSISKTAINLGMLSPNIESTDIATLSASFGGAGNYQVTVQEEGPLQTMAGAFIPDTECDSGPCTTTDPRPWTSSTTYGFGYRMAGEDVPTPFPTCGATCYVPFPDLLATPTPGTPAVVMSSDNVTVNLASKPKDIIHQSEITLKANVSPLQTAGTYQTVIHFVATPTF